MWPDDLKARFEIAKEYGNGTSFAVKCPVHEDNKASATLTIVDGKAKINCMVCRGVMPRATFWQRVLEATGTKAEQWWSDCGSPEPGRRAMKLEDSYDYFKVDGTLYFQTVRQVDEKTGEKKFLVRRPRMADEAGKGRGKDKDWLWSAPAIMANEPALYRLPEIMSSNGDTPVFVCEGERDADTMAALGFVGTTNAFGAANWDINAAKVLRGRNVCILEDNDDSGQCRTAIVAGSLIVHGARAIRIVRFRHLAEKADVTDFVFAAVEHKPDGYIRTATLFEKNHPRRELARMAFINHLLATSELWKPEVTARPPASVTSPGQGANDGPAESPATSVDEPVGEPGAEDSETL